MSKHLRLVRSDEKKPAPRAYPKRIDGVDLRRVGFGRWWLQHHKGGRTIDLWLTTPELQDLAAMAASLLARDAEDQP